MILAAWLCKRCDVAGRDPEPVACWHCGGAVTITARVYVKR